MRNSIKTVVCIFIFSIYLISCSDSKKASKPTFEKAINSYLSKCPPMILGGFLEYPGVISNGFAGKNIQPKVELLIKFGLVNYTGDSIIDGHKSKKYDASDMGKKLLTEKEITSLLGKNKFQGFVFAKEKVVEIVSYTEPADFMGKKVSEVKYKSSLYNVADWAKDQDIQTNFNNIKEYISPDYSTQIKKAVLILTSEGWIHEQLMSE